MKKINKKKIDICGKGGAADGLAYFGILKEMWIKGIRLGKAALTSASTLMFTMQACGYSPRQTKVILKELPFDRMMRAEKQVENKEGSIKTNVLKAVWVFVTVKTFWGWKMNKLLKKYLSWELVRKTGRVDKLLIGFTTREELKKIKPKKRMFIIEMIQLLSNKISRVECERGWKECRMFWAGCDGVYAVNTKTRKFVKYSNDIIPLDIAVRCAIKNPAMNNFKIKLRGKKVRPFDLGIINNESNMAFIDRPRDSFHQFSCGALPEDEFLQGDSTLSDFIYNQHRPINEHVFMPARPKGFLSFNNKEVDFEYDHQPPTNIFK